MLALLTAGAVFVVHDLGYVLSQPYWIDEAWVADSTRAPLHLVPSLSAVTPLGWTLLLRLVPGGGLQDARLLPLAFCAGAVLAAYYLGRELRLTRVLTALLTAASVLLVPTMLVRNDLKPYTAEAALTILLLLLVARVEREWDRRRLAWLAGVAGAGLLVTNTTIFVGVAAMGALGLAALPRRQWRRLAEIAVASAGMLVVQATIYIGIDERHTNPSLTSYWDDYYIPRDHGVSGIVSFVRHRGALVVPYLGFHSVIVVLVLVLGGLGTLTYLHRPALALVTPLTIGLVMVASAARKFPFLEPRTSTFWLVAVAVLMAIGVAGAISAIETISTPAAVASGLAGLAVWVIVTAPHVRTHLIPNEDVRDQVAYVDAHRRPGDLVIVDFTSNWGFAYYERSVHPSYRHIASAATGFMATYPGVAWIDQMTGFTASDVDQAWVTATKYANRHHGARVWIIRSHVEPTEAGRWSIILRRRPVNVLNVGPEPLLLYQPDTH